MASNRASSSGPDWKDVVLMMTELEVLHAVSVNLLMSRDGGLESGSMSIVGVAMRHEAPDGGVPRSVSRRHTFPNASSVEMAAACYRLLIELDWDCSSMWVQKRLPEA